MMILGIVSWMQPVHGYDVRRELVSWNADKWAKIQPGSIYHALKKLTEEGLLREAGTEQMGARPERRTYEITPKGRDVFEELLRGEWWELKLPIDPFQAAFAFLPALPRKEAAAALRHRARMLRAATDGFRDMIDTGMSGVNKPIHVRWMFELWIARSEGEITWCERIAEQVESGVSYLPETVTNGGEEMGWEAFREQVAE